MPRLVMLCGQVTSLVKQMKQGPPLHEADVDCGAICMGPRQMAHYQRLVGDAVAKGAKVGRGLSQSAHRHLKGATTCMYVPPPPPRRARCLRMCARC